MANYDPAPDPTTENTWIDRFGHEAEKLRTAWQATEQSHDDMVLMRQARGMPAYNEDWTEQNELDYQKFSAVVAYVINYFDEVHRRVRAVAYDPSIGNLVALGTVGEPSFSVEGGDTLVVTIPGNQPVRVRADGTVGANVPAWAWPVAVAVAAIAVAGLVYVICDTIQKETKAASENDTRRHVEALQAKGYTAEQIEAILNGENKQMESRNKDPLTEFMSGLKVLAVVGGIIGVVGAGVYVLHEYWPSKRKAAVA